MNILLVFVSSFCPFPVLFGCLLLLFSFLLPLPSAHCHEYTQHVAPLFLFISKFFWKISRKKVFVQFGIWSFLIVILNKNGQLYGLSCWDMFKMNHICQQPLVNLFLLLLFQHLAYDLHAVFGPGTGLTLSMVSLSLYCNLPLMSVEVLLINPLIFKVFIFLGYLVL